LRCFDCKVPADREVMAGAPLIQDSLCAVCRDHFGRVRALLDGLGVPYELDPRLVRGLDYYRRTAFEVTLPGLGAQNALLGGGRYDGLVEALGGPAVPGFGFAVGEDRLVMSLAPDLPIPGDAPDASIVALGEAAATRALAIARRLRLGGHRVVYDPLPDRSLKAQMRRAHDRGSRFVLILGDDEIRQGVLVLKRMADGRQETVGEADLEGRLHEMARA
jgi:histidyl-tRNA synthetase